MKQKFLNNEVWILTFAGGFQRANVYQKEASEAERLDFRLALRAEIEKIVEKYYRATEVSSKEHLKHIKSIIDFTKKYGASHPSLLNQDNKEALNFGITQKVFNLYLKYLWALGQIKTPPHFPVDRIIQMKLRKKEREIISWTKDLDEKNYMALMGFARTKLEENKVSSLAELELVLFERR
jgi:hypothetical protein